MLRPDVYGNISESLRITGAAASAAVAAGSDAEAALAISAAVRFCWAHRLMSSVASPSTSADRARERSPWSCASPTSFRRSKAWSCRAWVYSWAYVICSTGPIAPVLVTTYMCLVLSS